MMNNDASSSFAPSSLAYNKAKTIIRINNMGATSLSSGDTKSAISFFRQALRTSKSAIMHDREEIRQQEQQVVTSSPTSSSSSSSSSEASSEGFKIDCLLSPTKSTSSQESENDDKGEDFIIREKPIFVDELHAANTTLQRSETILPSILIFNLALTHQLLAADVLSMKNIDAAAIESSSARKLQKAVYLYKLTMQMQQNATKVTTPAEERSACSDGSKIFFMSCLNNLCGAFRSLGDEKSERRTHQQLLMILMYLSFNEQQQTQQPVSETRNNNNNNEYAPFFQNVFQKETNTVARAA